MSDEAETVNHPKHYTSHPSGIEAIDICEYLSFNIGNALKYIWRAGLKKTDAREDLRKALWYLERELVRQSLLRKSPAAWEALLNYANYPALLVETLKRLVEKAEPDNGLLGRVCGTDVAGWHHLVSQEIEKLEERASE